MFSGLLINHPPPLPGRGNFKLDASLLKRGRRCGWQDKRGILGKGGWVWEDVDVGWWMEGRMKDMDGRVGGHWGSVGGRINRRVRASLLDSTLSSTHKGHEHHYLRTRLEP